MNSVARAENATLCSFINAKYCRRVDVYASVQTTSYIPHHTLIQPYFNTLYDQRCNSNAYISLYSWQLARRTGTVCRTIANGPGATTVTVILALHLTELLIKIAFASTDETES